MNTVNEKFSQIYKQYINSLYRFGISMGIPHDTCLDIIHDVFCKLIKKNEVFETDCMKSYLFRCFTNRYIDIKKSQKNVISGDFNDLPFTIEVSLEDTSIEGYMIEEEEKEALKQKIEFLLGFLTPRQRKAIYLRYMEEMEYDEIAELLDMSAESVRKLVFRGLEKLRKHAGNIPMFYFLSILFRAAYI
ncbi:MAG: RNA polymerase sigma factor [Candidatus Azobacteroides sp.]|nr:RNA polymerase sigma factor [Candidatus Azobacteroides sp.]